MRAPFPAAGRESAMPIRFSSLKTRTALAMSAVIVAILVANAVWLILRERARLREGIQERARTFALLTRAPIATGYEMYYQSGFLKFRELMTDLMKLNGDVERILIIDVSGRILFDSRELDDPGAMAPGSVARFVAEPERLEAVKRLDETVLRGVDENGRETLEIIAPFLEDWGRHKLSVAYQVSYENLRPDIARLVYATAGLTLLSIGLSVLVAAALATRITRPLEELTAGAQEIAEGHFDRRLQIRSNDELQILSEAFNDMAGRLKLNVEELEESNRKLAAVNEELKELDRMKSDLLANVSHELRTPLTAIKGYTDYILERKLGTITDKQEKGLVVVQRNLERLSKSINALLDFSRMDSGRIALNVAPFPLRLLVEQIHTTVRSELERKRLSLVIDVDPDLPPVLGDREKLSAVLENLVINALKFTPEGGRITVGAHRAEGLNGARPEAELRVSDTGIGIPHDQLGRIFVRFHQVDGSSTRRYGGVGLGLAIVKSILDAHEAPVHVDSQLGRGTTFRFRLPLAEAAEQHHPAAEPAGPSLAEPPEEGLVLVVDDDPAVARLVSECLAPARLAVLAAGTAEQGALMARDRHPDVILLDIFLPDRSGLDLLQALKEDPVTRGIPVMIVSVSRDAARGITLGAAEYMVKPLDRAAMAAVVGRLMAGAAADGDPTVLIVDDEHDTAEMLRDTLRAEGFHTMVAHSGRQALELVKRRRPQVVVLDIMMPEMSGFEVLQALNGDAATAGIPVLVLTARGDDTDRRRGLALGARSYMSKPFEVRALLEEVRRHVPHPAEARRVSL